MDKKEYLAQLANHLKGLPNDEFEDAMHYVEEYFDEAGEENEQKVIDELGAPAKYAAPIKAASTIKENNKESTSAIKPSSGIKTIWYIIAGICALPIALPMLAVVVALGFTLLALIFAVCVSVFAITVAGIFTLVPMFSSSITLLGSNMANGLMALGASLILLGIIVLIISIIIFLLSHFIPWVIKVLSNLFNKLKGGNNHEQ